MEKRLSVKKAAIITLISIVSVGCIILIIVQSITLKNIRNKIAKEEKQIEQTINSLKSITKFNKQEDTVGKNLLVLKKMLPENKSQGLLVNYIQEIVAGNNVRILQIRFEKEVKKHNYVELPLRISIEGKYNEILKVLGEIHNAERAIKIVEIKMQKNQKLADTVNCEIYANVFYCNP